ncbi:MAG TPA: DUF3488 domain-containing protein [Gammaproteobacteria bacterium]|nr:DUF3488 domain-containing protein [Gammaproteobacteria bacterium]
MEHLRQALAWRWRQVERPQLWLLVGLALALLPHVGRLPWLLILPAALLLGWRLGFELKLVRLPSQMLRWLLVGLALAATWASYHTLIGRQAGVALLVIMLCLKLMEMDRPRDVAIVIGLSYFVVITVFLFDQSLLMGGYMLLVVTLLTTALTAFSRASAKLPQRANLRLAATLLAQAAPLALLLFMLFPRIPGPLWHLPSDGGSASTGLSDTMAPGNISRLSDNGAVAFRVRFAGETPPQDRLYWRGLALTHFDGRTWRNPNETRRGLDVSYDIEYTATGAPVDYTLTLEPHQRRWLFALDMPAGAPPRSRVSEDVEIIARDSVKTLRQYTLRSYTEYRLGTGSAPRDFAYLSLPSGTAPRARILARQLRAESSDDADYLQRVLDFIRQQPFYYTRRPPLLLDDPVDEFLFDNRRGFCEHYASAFTVLMRAAGLPARVMTGYQGGENNPLGDYFIVRQSDAHAWSEVWLRGRGWVRVDPTAVIPPGRVENPADLERIDPAYAARTRETPDWAKRLWRQMGFGWDRVNNAWNQWIIGYDQGAQRGFLSRLGLEDVDWQRMVGLLFGGLGLVVALIALQLFRHRPLRRDAVGEAYARFCRKLARRGLPRKPAEGAQDYSQRVIPRRPELAAQIQHITLLYQRLRYARAAPRDGLRHLKQAVRRFRP